MLSIYNFEGRCDSRIFHRGEGYYYGEAVSDFKIIGNNYSAIVSGTYDYELAATLGAEGEILEASCTCPYDRGICKHMVAFFLEIRESLIKSINEAKEPVSDENKKSYLEALNSAIKEKSKKEIIDILYKVTQDSFTKQQQTLALIENKLSAVHLISIVEEGVRRYGPKKQIISAIKLVVNLTDEEKNNEIEHALAFLEIYRILITIKNDYEEEAGLTEDGFYYDSFDYDYFSDEYEVFFGEEMLTVLAILIKEKFAVIIKTNAEADNNLISGIINFLSSMPFYLEDTNNQTIFNTLAHCAHIKEVYESFLGVFNNIEDFPRQYSGMQFFTYDFFFELINTFGTKVELDFFVSENREYSPFREYLIKEAISRADYKAAIVLAKEGNVDLENRYLNSNHKSKWDVYLVEIYTALHDFTNIRKPALKLLQARELTYYEIYKKTFTAEGWKKELPSLLRKLKDNNVVYHYVLAREKEWGKILSLALNDLTALFNTYIFFPQSYGPQIIRLIKNGIDPFIKSVTGRANYGGLVYYLVVLQKFLTSSELATYLNELRQTYWRRRALLKYLNGLHFPISDLEPGINYSYNSDF